MSVVVPVRRRWPALAAVLWLVSASGVLLAFVLSRQDPHGPAPLAFWALAVTFPPVGTVIVARRPRNVIGWLMTVEGIAAALVVLCFQYVGYSQNRFGDALGTTFAAWMAQTCGALMALLLFFIVLLYPEGHLLSRRWRPVAAALALCALASVLLIAVAPGELLEGSFPLPIENPLGVDALGAMTWLVPVSTLEAALAIVTVNVLVRLVRHVARRSHSVERQQLQWFILATSLALIVFVAGFADLIAPNLFDWLLPLAISGIPLAIGLSILRYRLYDIERVVSRTVVLMVLGFVLVLSYVVLVDLLDVSVPQDRLLIVVGGMLAVTALLQRFRGQVQRVVDRWLNPSRYAADQILAGIERSLRDEVDFDVVRSDLLDGVRRTVQPATVNLWLVDSSHGGARLSQGAPGVDDSSPPALSRLSSGGRHDAFETSGNDRPM